MKLSLNIATLATLLLLAAFAQAKEKTPALRRGLKDRNNGADNYFALVTSVAQEDTGCMSSTLGSVVATVRDAIFCVKFSYAGMSSGGPADIFSHIHGPAADGETGPVIFTMDTSTDKMQCFELTKYQMKDLDDELWYFDVHSEMCPNDESRGQILPLLSNVDHIVKQLRQTDEAVTEARI
jgi:hypothetical protein